MPSNIVLECAQIDGSDPSNQGAEWTTTLQHPIPIEEGDVITLKQALINTNNVSSGNIVFETDQNVSMTLGFYDNFNKVVISNLLSGAKVGIQGEKGSGVEKVFQEFEATIGEDGNSANKFLDFYNAEFGDTMRFLTNTAGNGLFTRDVTFTVPAGSYSPNTLASLMTDELYGSYDNSLKITGYTSDNNTGLLICPGLMGSTVQPKSLKVGSTSDFVTYIAPPGPTQPPHPQVSNFFVKAADNTLVSPEAGATELADHPNGVVSISSSRLVGARNITIAFEGNRFKFKSLHSPLFSATTQGDFSNPVTVSSIQMPSTEATSQMAITHASDTGCFITQLEPQSFWTALGFSSTFLENKVYVEYDKLTQTDGAAYLAKRIVQQQVPTIVVSTQELPCAARLNPEVNTQSNPNETPPVFDSTAQVSVADAAATTSINADTPYLVDNTGYYLLEATANFDNDYYDQTSRMSSVVAAVSKQYNSNDFITGYADSGIAYTHVGATQILSSLRLRVLDPQTKELAGGLGDNSTVILEVMKAPKKT